MTAWPRWTGDVITPWLTTQVELLTRRYQYSVEVFTSRYKGGGATAWSSDDVIEYPVHRFRYFPAKWENLTHEKQAFHVASSWSGMLKAACYMVYGCLAIWELNRKKHYDWVHVHWGWPHMLFGVVAKAANPRVKVAVTFYGAEFAAIRGKFVYQWLLRRWLRHADRVVAISTYTADLARLFTDKEIEVIPYGSTLSDG